MTLKLEGVNVHYGQTHAVKDVSLELPGGEILALLGASGSGKSSLLRAVAGLEPARGKILFDGEDVSGIPVHRRGFGLMFQDGQLFGHKNVAQNVAYGLHGRLPREQWAARVEELLTLVGLPGTQERGVHTLSGGQQQRVALARALAPKPRLLLLDEPLSALDRALREDLSVEIRGIVRETGTTAIYVTHDQDEAFTVADTVAIMEDGVVARIGTPSEVWTDPRTRSVSQFLGFDLHLDEELAASLGIEVPAGMILACGPDAWHVARPGEKHVPAKVVEAHVIPGAKQVSVELPTGEQARILMPIRRSLYSDVLRLGLDESKCALVTK
ncbi:MAG: ABC transporter ATP-binding protein [Actinomycetaceae bacterium]|nr:ABC transporter ATP-binding protein [Actinomycetaceae bacterium]